MRRFGWVVLVGCLGLRAQTVVSVPVPLLPQNFGGWYQFGGPVGRTTPGFSLVNVDKNALEECGPQRSQTKDYTTGGRWLHVEAVEFNDATGAYGAFTLALRPGLKVDKEIGTATAVGDGGVLFETGSSIALAYPATAADVPELKKLADAMPKVSGPRSQPPLLPTFVPAKGLVQGSVRYAVGPQSYSAIGGTLDAGKLGWEKSAEAATAEYADRRGKETLTLLLYPTPQIAAEHTRALEAQTGIKTRREGELVMVAAGTFSAADAQGMIDGIHLRSEVTFDKAMPPVFETEVKKTYSLLTSILVFCGVGTLASVLLGLFLGGGRALFRVMRGKDAATDAEFLSLHLEPQNPRPKFDPPAS
jgi:hypothetical protein